MLERYRSQLPIIALLLIYGAILLSFPLKMQAMESYAYAAAAEGYYNLSTTFALMQPGVHLPNISNYHPNHPLGHILTRALHPWTGVGALTIFRATNFFAALIVLICFYQSALFLLRRVFPAVASSVLFIFSYVFWGSALSGEVQLPSLACLSVATYYLLRYLVHPSANAQNLSDALTEKPVANTRHLWFAGLFFVLGLAFHLSAILWILPAAASTLLHSAKKDKWKLYAALTALIVGGFIIFYVILVVVVLKIDTAELYWRTAQMYRYINNEKFPLAQWFTIAGNTFFKSLVFDNGAWGVLSKILIATIVLAGYYSLARSSIPPAIKFFIVSWPVIQFIVWIIVDFRPDAMNGWLFVYPSFFLAAGFFLRLLWLRLRFPLILFSLASIPAVTNFYFAILPQKSVENIYHLRATDFNALPVQTPIGFYVTDPVLTFAEIWAAGSLFARREQAIFLPCCGERDTAAHIQDWIDKYERDLILVTDERSDTIETILSSQKRSFVLLRETQTHMKPEWLPSSIYFTREPGYIINKNIRIFKINSKGTP